MAAAGPYRSERMIQAQVTSFKEDMGVELASGIIYCALGFSHRKGVISTFFPSIKL